MSHYLPADTSINLRDYAARGYSLQLTDWHDAERAPILSATASAARFRPFRVEATATGYHARAVDVIEHVEANGFDAADVPAVVVRNALRVLTASTRY